MRITIILIICFLLLSTMLNAENTVEFDKETVLQKNIKYGWNSTSAWKNARSELKENMIVFHEWENKKQSHLTNCLKSMVAPGWGHFSTKNYLKGEILLGMQIVLAGSAYYFWDQSNDFYEKYQNATQIDEINQYYIDANSSYRTSGIFLGLWIIVWGYTVFDTIQATENYNRDLWVTLYDEYQQKKFALTPTGIKIHF